MGDHEYGAPFHQVIHTLLHDTLGSGIDGRCRLVKDQDRRICDRRSRDREQLSLSLGEFFSVAAQLSIIPVRQHPDKSVRMCQLCSLYYFFIGRIQLAVADIFFDRSGKQMCILKNDTERPSQVSLLYLINIDVVIPDLSVRHIIETVDQVGDRRLSCAGGTDERQLLSRFCIQCQIMEHHMIRSVAERHIVETHIAFQLLIGHCAVRLMRVFPRPETCTLTALCNIAIRILLRIYQGDISVVNLRLFIHHVEDTLRSGERHDNGVELLRDLHERLGKALCELQVGCHNSQRDVSDAGNRQESAEHSRQNKLQISEVSYDGTHHTCKCMRSGCTCKQLIIELVELFFRHLFVIEHLDNTLSVHSLFHKSGHACQIELLADEVLSTVPRHSLCHKDHHKNHHDRQDRKNRA